MISYDRHSNRTFNPREFRNHLSANDVCDMREIKFRAWDRLSSKIRNVKDIIGMSDHGFGVRFKDQNDELDFTGGAYVNLMQYTGLKDKNGKEIYEGDVVKMPSFSPELNIVRFDRGGFCLEPITGIESHFWSDIKYAEDDNSEIIGNIYENPEILK